MKPSSGAINGFWTKIYVLTSLLHINRLIKDVQVANMDKLYAINQIQICNVSLVQTAAK